MRNKVKKSIFFFFGALVIMLLMVMVYLTTMLPQVGDPEIITVEQTPERVERGRYLANHVAVCIDCHSERDWSVFSGPLFPGTEGQGGEIFDQSMGFPGRFISPNITPYGIGEWTDGEVLRAITTGVSKDGSSLFSIMPYHNYGKMDREDVLSIIAYIRTLKPVEKVNEVSRPDFPMNFILNTLPEKAAFANKPAKEDVANYGKYLVTTASCYDCHTKQVKGKFTGEPFAGGFEFLFPDGSILQSANITPDETGIGKWSKEDFIARFKAYADSLYVPQKLQPGEMQSPMPWTFYAHMDEEDLAAMFAYIKTLTPVDQVVTIYQPAASLKQKE